MAERLKKVLVAYSTLSGCTTTIARRIGADLIAYGVRPQVLSVEELPTVPSDIDAIIFGSGIRMGKFHKEAREWMDANAKILSTRPVALFSVGLHAAVAQTEGKAAKDLDNALHEVSFSLHPASSEVLPGWKRSDGFSSMEKLALRVYPLAEGDYRDWDKVDRWVQAAAPVLLGHGPTAPCVPMRKY